jgi:hypothetical protein
MSFLMKFVVPAVGVFALMAAYDAYGFQGLALVLGAIVMWVLLYFTRLMAVLRRASGRPIGYCDSAVMLNAKLRKGVNLMHVIALTRALGEQLSPPDTEPEVYKWTDTSDSSVTAQFRNGKLMEWVLQRPVPAAAQAPAEPAPPAP